ncbi:C-C motif chemokine 4-like [Lates japonicus]|uniref:C-C motif chemokine 4-like protein n=1 Tax=Lates japonicus TaxID=270547 RepID=A0AAD3N9S8_LATJO|nr:C-C motif chemokine 4-like protein [Lates japonicus]
MKTMSFTVGLLLLLTVDYCTAMPRAVNELSPGSCCFTFFKGRISQEHIISIIKTHSRCQHKGFVVSVAKGKICVNQSVGWARGAYNQHRLI